MTTLQAIRQDMLARAQGDLGRVENIASLTVTTMVVSALAVGTLEPEKFINKWLLRPDVASPNQAADRSRLITNYASATGTLTHAGTNYADTTATSETVEILEHEPTLYDQAIQRALARAKRPYEWTFPAMGEGRYWLDGLTWLTSPGQIERVELRSSPVLTRNRNMEQWGVVSTGGVLQPDDWTLAGAAGVWTRSTTARRGAYSLSATRAGTTLTISQALRVMGSGISANSLRGQTVTGVLVARSAQANSVRCSVLSRDASASVLSTTNSSFHTGSGTWQEITAQHTVHASAEELIFQATVAVDETALLDELYGCFGPLTDGIRADNWRVTARLDDRDYDFDPGPPLSIVLPSAGFAQQWAIVAPRPYPAFDATRVYGGTADDDTSDAPLGLIAEGALAELYRGLADTEASGDSQRYARLAAEHEDRYQALAAAHYYVKSAGGAPLPLRSPIGAYRSGRGL